VFGLSLYTQERDLREVFEHYGPVGEVQVVYDHQTGRSRGFAFIYMKSHSDAIEVSWQYATVTLSALASDVIFPRNTHEDILLA